MSLFYDKLANLKPGSHIRFVHTSGRIVEGIVAENDGSESLSIQITSLATVRYDQINLLEETQQFGIIPTVIPQTVIPTVSTPMQTVKENGSNNSVEILRLNCDKDTVSAAFKSLEINEKVELKSAYDKFQSFLKSHEPTKGEEALQLFKGIMVDSDWGYNPRVNLLAAYIALANEDYSYAAECFYYADNCRYAYCAAYQGAEKSDDNSLYISAAAFAAIYLTENEIPDSAEAIEVLRRVSDKAADISGVTYVLKNSESKAINTALRDTVRSLGESRLVMAEMTSETDKLLEKLKSHFPNGNVLELIQSYISDVSEISDFDEVPPEEPEEEPKPASFPAEPELNVEYDGKIVTYKFLDSTGKIEVEGGKRFAFNIKDITDTSLKNRVGKITVKEGFQPVPVKFMLTKLAGKYVAISIKAAAPPVKSAKVAKTAKTASPGALVGTNNSITQANLLFTAKKLPEAIAIYKQHLDGEEWEYPFAQIILCYLALSNEYEEFGYFEELTAFVEKYADRTFKDNRSLESLQQYYMKTHNYEKAIDVLNDLMEVCDPSEHGRLLHYLTGKARCYRFMQNYTSAISELLDWLEIVKKNKMTERIRQRDTTIYIELAELYFENNDLENAEKYYELSESTERAQAFAKKLAERKAPLASEEAEDGFDEDYEDFEERGEEFTEEPKESLQNVYEEYIDTSGFDALGIDDTAVFNTVMNFKPDELYCVLTYLYSAALLSSGSEKTRTDGSGKAVDVGQAIRLVNSAFSFAFNSPFLETEHRSSEIIPVFDDAQRFIPDISKSMFAAAALYALFNTQSTPDYTFEDLGVVVEAYGLESYSECLIPLIEALTEFKKVTGFGMDTFAGYKTSSTGIENVIANARECYDNLEKRNEIFENHGQVRKIRELMFTGEDSGLRECLKIAAENDVSRYTYVRDTVNELFIRANRPIMEANVDPKKLDKYIDGFWDLARDVILNEGKHIEKRHDKLMGNRRQNIVVAIRRMIQCVCDWLAVAEQAESADNDFARDEYVKRAEKVTDLLAELIHSCNGAIKANGFDWGTESLRRAASEILAKMNGSYSSKSRKYLFIGFLTGEEVLLDDSYLPEMQSTFCDMSDFNILRRIERHAQSEHISLHERLSEILSNDETKHNFRSAGLIKAYGEDMGITEITEHKELAQYKECRNQAKRRFDTKYQNFADELELFENYGTLSNINGEKDRIMEIAYRWYRITVLTSDYGFYARLLESIRATVSANAAEKGEQLRHQLEMLSNGNDGNKYDFGVFSKELIEEKINDLNYSSAEFIMSCILRGDVSEIFDYSGEPLGYFNDFISEHATNHRAVREAGKDIVTSIINFAGTNRDLESAMLQITNTHKEMRGGANLLKSWNHSGTRDKEQVENLLTRLGFRPVSVQPDTGIEAEAYRVVCRKQIGKVNFVHPIPAFGSKSETDGFRLLCLYGKYDCDSLMDKFRQVNNVAQHTLVLLDYTLNLEERRRLARKIKEEKSFARTFIVIDRVILFYLARHYAENTVIKRLMAVTLPFAYYQPFVESSTQNMPPELFTGREEALTSIESPEGAHLVYGGRQLGKSALLKMAQHNIDKNGNGDRAVLVEELKGKNSEEAVVIVCDKLISEGVLDASCKCETWRELAGHIQDRLKDENPETRIHYLLLMLDEADEVIRTSVQADDSPITELKKLPSDRFKLVMAGLHNLSRYNRAMTHKNSNLIHLTPIVIKQFRREEATKLLTSVLAYLGFKFEPAIIESILASTYNYPGLIQFYCQKLLEAMKNDYAGYAESGTPIYKVTENHYKKILSDADFTDLVNEKLEATLFAEEEVRSNYHIIALIIAYLYYTDPNEKGYTEEALLKVAEEYRIDRITALKTEQLSEILQEMLDLNIITDMNGYYRFATDGFRKLLGNQEKVEKSMSDYIEEGKAE